MTDEPYAYNSSKPYCLKHGLGHWTKDCSDLIKQERTDEISLCTNGCQCMTHTVDGNICGKCGAVKQERTDG